MFLIKVRFDLTEKKIPFLRLFNFFISYISPDLFCCDLLFCFSKLKTTTVLLSSRSFLCSLDASLTLVSLNTSRFCYYILHIISRTTRSLVLSHPSRLPLRLSANTSKNLLKFTIHKNIYSHSHSFVAYSARVCFLFPLIV